MQVSSIKEVLKNLIQTLQLAYLLPSILLNFYFYLFVLPSLYSKWDWKLENEFHDLIVVYSIILVSYLFYANNSWLIRLFEGYHFTNDPFIQKIYTKLKRPFVLEFLQLKRRVEKDFLYSDIPARKILENNYPIDKERILPTELGNVIAAFENYTQGRYGINSVSMWSRLVPILQENKYIENYISQKSVFDLNLNLTISVILIGISYLYLAIYKQYLHSLFYLLPLWLFTCFLLYRISIHAAYGWGIAVKVAFDLYRSDLAEKLKLGTFKNLKEEEAKWKLASKFILSKDEFDDYKNLFVYKQKEKTK
jgi:hypothetical protein